MARGTSWFLIAPLLLVGLLSGCRFGFETREPWRGEAEEQCIAAKGVVPSAFMEPLSAIDGPGMCGMDHPFRVHALAEGNVVLEPVGKLACPVIREVDMWVQEVVQPAALAWLGQPIVAISQMSAYSCRGMNGQAGAKISEHAFGNALDVGAFRTADGRWITVKDGWRGSPNERGFLLQVQAGACERFTTVLAPGSNAFHYDHIHMDLMRHQKGRSICKPAPRPMPAPMLATAPPVYAPPSDPVPVAPPPPELPPVSAAPGAPPPSYPPPSDYPPAARPAVPSRAIPPGWDVGPESLRPPGPMSYGPGGAPHETGSVKRKYYTSPIPQPSTIPLPRAKAGED